jgi:hypothetical protein
MRTNNQESTAGSEIAKDSNGDGDDDDDDDEES